MRCTSCLVVLAWVAGVANAGLVVDTKQGRVQGRVDKSTGSHYYFGIPFAKPPVGTLRFAPPVMHEGWGNTTLILPEKPTPVCPQQKRDGTFQGQEDCLTLNAYAPAAANPGEKRAVLVYIYGGGFVAGTDSAPDTNGRSFAANKNIVVFEMNYRLGALGFLSLNSLKSSHGTTGNWGLLDQQLAMRWVHDNAAAFGGDPSRVTIFGESAGAISTVAHFALPGSVPYFAQAMAESSVPVSDIMFWSERNASAFGEYYAASVGCNGTGSAQLQCLHTAPIEKVLQPLLDWRRRYPAEAQQYCSRLMPIMPFWPTVDGTTMPVAPGDLAEAGNFPDKPFIMGTNKDEGTIFAPTIPLSVVADPPVTYPLTPLGFNNSVRHLFNESATRSIIPFYNARYATPTDAVNALQRDYMFSCPTRHLMRTAATHPGRQAPFYLYQFRPNMHDGELGDFHGSEIPYVWNQSQPTWTRAEQGLADLMHSYWASFAETGVPQCAGCPVWEKYTYDPTTGTDNYLPFTTPPSPMGLNLLKDNCDFLDTFGYKQNP